MDALMTLSPEDFSTGMLSPVRALSSTEVMPSRMTPSTGILAPGRTITVSPSFSSSTGISISSPLLSTVAVFGARSKSLLIASEVFPLDLASRYFPTVISVRIIDADSKYKSMWY